MRNVKGYFLLIIIITLILFSACSPNRHLSKNGYLLSKNKLKIDNKTIGSGDIVNYIQQDPNHKLLGMKLGMYVYSASRPGDDSICNFFEKYILRTVGDKPVEISNDLTELSCKNIKTYLKTHGCFNAEIKTELLPVRRWYAPWTYYNRRRTVSYSVHAPMRAVVDTFIVNIEDPKLVSTAEDFFKQPYFNKGEWYDEDKMVALRSEFSQYMLDRGYYAFAPKYVTFDVDTNDGIDKTKIIMNVENPSYQTGDSTTIARHKPYKISKIYIYPNYLSTASPDYVPYKDTVLFFHKQQRGYTVTPLYFINNEDKPSIKEKSIMRCILMQNNNIFSPSVIQNTYGALSQLRNFKYIDIAYEDITKEQKDTNDLACFIRLTRNNPISLSSSFEFNYSANNDIHAENSSSSNLGMAGNLSYMDKNLLHGAEIFTANLKLAAEINSNIFKKDNTNKGWDIFNAFEAGVDFGIELPRFLAPFSTSFYSMKFHPHTSIKTGYNVQKRYYYERSIFNVNYGYSWNTSDKKYFSFIPLEVNYVNMDITDKDYADFIKSMDKRIQYQMSDHLVMAMRFTYTYNGQTVESQRDFNYFSFNIESAGNVLDLYPMAVNQSKNEQDHYTIFKIPFSQYVRTDFAFTHYNFMKKNTSFVYKIYGGIGVPYANAEALPYEKAFFGGGANNLRAWQLRSLGPGSSKPSGSTTYDRAGDIALGASFEYRFPLISILNGAAFVDMGNVWTLRNEEGLEGGKISKDFYKEIACGVGLGLRLDIKLFIFRLDFALKAWDPSKTQVKDRFVLDNAGFKDIVLQFGIGYPF